jgi:hypothetical protein
MIQERLENYKDDQCWQYNIRVKNLEADLISCGLTKEYTDNLRVSDFDFRLVTDKKEQKNLKSFIERHEWLGNISQYTTHWFACYHKDIIAGVILFNTPNAFSKLLGENTKNLERLQVYVANSLLKYEGLSLTKTKPTQSESDENDEI